MCAAREACAGMREGEQEGKKQGEAGGRPTLQPANIKRGIDTKSDSCSSSYLPCLCSQELHEALQARVLGVRSVAGLYPPHAACKQLGRV